MSFIVIGKRMYAPDGIILLFFMCVGIKSAYRRMNGIYNI